MGCTFCATGWGGFDRQLTAGEIVGQYRASRRWADENDYGPISNIVYMGMGEPLSNRKAVMPSLTILNQAYGVGARRITVSTVGVTPGILELAERVIAAAGGGRIERLPYEEAYGAGFEDMQRRVPDITKINQAIGFAPQLNLDDIIRDCVQYVSESLALNVRC